MVPIADRWNAVVLGFPNTLVGTKPRQPSSSLVFHPFFSHLLNAKHIRMEVLETADKGRSPIRPVGGALAVLPYIKGHDRHNHLPSWIAAAAGGGRRDRRC